VPGVAEADGFEGQRFRPAVGGAGGFVVERALVPAHLDLSAGLFFHFADDPVVLVDEATGNEVGRPLHRAITMDLVFSIGLFDFAELAVLLPIHMIYEGDAFTLGGGRVGHIPNKLEHLQCLGKTQVEGAERTTRLGQRDVHLTY
jgi:hypothetical protein